MYSNLFGFLDIHNLIYARQFRLCKGHSTIHALLNITKRIRKCLDKGEFACGVFVDLQKAFDHKILLSKLDHYGVHGCCNDWFRSYLSDRLQFVSIGTPTLILSQLNTVSHKALCWVLCYFLSISMIFIGLSNTLKLFTLLTILIFCIFQRPLRPFAQRLTLTSES